MFISDIAFKREGTLSKDWRRIGKLWWGGDRHYAKLFLTALRQGKFVGRLYRGMEPPKHPIIGDLVAPSGWLESPDGKRKRLYQPCGYIQTDTDAVGGIRFFGEIDCLPVTLLIDKESINGDGIWIRVKLDSEEEGDAKDDGNP